jgi:copper chaperone
MRADALLRMLWSISEPPRGSLVVRQRAPVPVMIATIRSHAMKFQVSHPIADSVELLRVLRVHDALAQIELDAAAGTIKVLGQLDANQAAAAFGRVGIDARPLADARDAHVSGGSTCCGHCA